MILLKFYGKIKIYTEKKYRINMSSFSTKLSNFLGIFNKEKKINDQTLTLYESNNISILEYNNNAKETLSGFHKLDKENHTDKDYCSFVVNYYQSLGFTVWEYSKDLALPESEIHLIIKKGFDIFLIQCRNDSHNLNKENICSFEEQSQAFIMQHQIFESYNVKLIYTMSSLQFDESAYKYIKSSNNINYEILKSHAN